MTGITRKNLELCAELLGCEYEYDHWRFRDTRETFDPIEFAVDREALAKAAKLEINWSDQYVCLPEFKNAEGDYTYKGWSWPQDGTYETCLIKAAAAVMRARKQA